MKPGTESEHYERAWGEYRFLTIFAYAFIPMAMGLLYVNDRLRVVHPAAILMVFVVAGAFVGVRMLVWKCPRCGSRKSRLFGSPLWIKACRSCGLKRYEIPDRV